ncbi:hypothetical protein D2T29_12690 [Sinirhodobacter populi]|uniref:Uncharacterized protein n=1 Tax=Paenirhodobacter populi TaxID=2306993 RepID=A0A443KD09_9RHOB|nr:hypothetical protein [Sinirhodobacter populi]RWR30522.1 hypothetical protein D2T29_12690 [Sinirhodobacter populi]
MAATYMLRRHLAEREAAQRPDACAARATEIEAAKRAKADMETRFPKITPATFEAADQYHKERLCHWRAALSK